MQLLSAFLFGVVFALGLGLAGMTQPSRIVGFLDVTGDWDPTLLFVMVGAVGLAGLSFPWVLRRRRPLLNPSFRLPERSAVDLRLLLGAAVFGIGWGLSGYCPGPALVSLVSGAEPVIVFVFSMMIGLLLGRWTREVWLASKPEDSTSEPERDTTPRECGQHDAVAPHPHSRRL